MAAKHLMQSTILAAFAILIAGCGESISPPSASSASQPAIDQLLDAPLLVVYVNPRCSHCAKARAWLDQRRIVYEARDVRLPHYRQEFVALGGRGVPLFVAKGERLQGFSASELSAFLERSAIRAHD